MKILITNNTLDVIGGSETYAYALILELIRKGHDVEAMSASTLGLISNKLIEKGVKVTTSPQSSVYDAILTSHNSSASKIMNLKGFKIQTCHGVGHHLEQPMKNMDAYVAISVEVGIHLVRSGYTPTIIHNGIDTKRFYPRIPINKTLKSVLSLSQFAPFNTLLLGICKNIGVKFKSFNKFTNPVFNIEDYINDSDMVVSIGRGAYESLSCGRVVMCLDNRNYMGAIPIGDGILTEHNIEDSLKNNCTGRFSMRKFKSQDIVNEFKKYDSSIGKFGREYALENLNISKQVDKYLELLNS